MELTLAWNGKGCQFLQVFVQLHLPESRSEVQSGENCGVGPADVGDTFVDFLYRVFVNVGVLVEFPEVLNESLTLFLWNTENG